MWGGRGLPTAKPDAPWRDLEEPRADLATSQPSTTPTKDLYPHPTHTGEKKNLLVYSVRKSGRNRWAPRTSDPMKNEPSNSEPVLLVDGERNETRPRLGDVDRSNSPRGEEAIDVDSSIRGDDQGDRAPEGLKTPTIEGKIVKSREKFQFHQREECFSAESSPALCRATTLSPRARDVPIWARAGSAAGGRRSPL